MGGIKMEYVRLGKTGVRVSRLGFGCMRYHQDEEEAIRAVNRAIDLGINYFETAIGYGAGRSEIILGKAIKGRRNQVYISTKSNPNDTKTASGMRQALDKSLKKLEEERVDFYQMWGVNSPEALQITLAKGGPLEGAKKAREEGLIGHIGITTHDRPENIIRAIETGEFESVTIIYNLLHRQNEPVLEAAAKHDVGVVIMRPLGGGVFTVFSDKLRFWEKIGESSPTIAALRYLFSNPLVHCVISGMEKTIEVEQNVKVLDLPRLTPEERRLLENACEEYVQKLGEKICGLCMYCVPCPQDIWIPEAMIAWNAYRLGFMDEARQICDKMRSDFEKCTECEECISKCPDSLPIPGRIKELLEVFK